MALTEKENLIEQSKVIVKSNHLIEARYKLSLQESHVILWLLTQIRTEDKNFKKHKMEITEFSKMMGIKAESQYKELRNITKRLMQRIMEIYSPEKQEYIQVAWLSSAVYQHKKGCVLLEFSPELKPYLLQLKSCFTKIDITDLLNFRSIYAVRAYELLVQYSPIGKREISVDELRSYCGIAEDEYENYFDVKRKVINRSKQEINEKTGYKVDYKEIKKGRRIVALGWTIKSPQKNPVVRIHTTEKKSSTPKSSELPEDWQKINVDALKDIGLTAAHVDQIWQKDMLTAEEMQNSIDYFAFDLDVNDKRKSIQGSPLQYLMGILLKRMPYTAPANYTPHKAQSQPSLTLEEAIQTTDCVKGREVIEYLFKELGEGPYRTWFHSNGFEAIGLREGKPYFYIKGDDGEGESWTRSQINTRYGDVLQQVFQEVYG